jgi:hypothetical protein
VECLGGNPVAINDWSYRRAWKIIGKQLIAADSNRPLSLYKEGNWLYANLSKDYIVLEVEVKRMEFLVEHEDLLGC